MDGWEPIFYKIWGGMEEKCLRWEKIGKTGRRRCVSKRSGEPPIMMTDFGGVSICGRRGGNSFINT